MLRSYQIAKKNLKSHRARTFLTVLGVAIGVFIITLVLIISGGLRQGLLNQVSTLSDRLIVVRNNFSSATGLNAFSPLTVTPATTLNEADARAITQTDGVQASAPMIFSAGTVRGAQNSYQGADIVATTNVFPRVFQLKFASGGFFDSNDPQSNEVVLGRKLAVGLLGTDQAAGQIISLKNADFIVVGVLDELDQPISLSGVDIDKTAFVPLNQTALLGVGQQIGQIVSRATTNQMNKTEVNIANALAKNHADHSEYTIQTGRKAANILSGWLLTLTTAALILASVSLVVGGIGIMNIMFVSVMERTREIGIRKAVGATRYNIFTQFLVEALIITLYGGLMGFVAAYLVGSVIDLNFSFPLIITPEIILIGFGVPILIGLIFGTWPATRSARQDPIRALKNPN